MAWFNASGGSRRASAKQSNSSNNNNSSSSSNNNTKKSKNKKHKRTNSSNLDSDDESTLTTMSTRSQMGQELTSYKNYQSPKEGLLKHKKGYGSRTTSTTTTVSTGDSGNLGPAINMDQAIELVGNGPFQTRILIAAGLCFASDSMEVLLLSFLAVVLQAEWGLTDGQTDAITSSVFVGAMLGTLTLGPLGDKLGRKPVFTATAAIISLFGFLTAAATNYPALLMIRFLVGFGVGGTFLYDYTVYRYRYRYI
jgi:hypothetical protein